MPGLRDTPAYKALQAHYDSQKDKISILQLCEDKARFGNYHQTFKTKDGDILVRQGDLITSSDGVGGREGSVRTEARHHGDITGVFGVRQSGPSFRYVPETGVHMAASCLVRSTHNHDPPEACQCKHFAIIAPLCRWTTPRTASPMRR